MLSNSPPASEKTHNKSLVYRHDIDGLRALAVFAVFLFHAFPKYLKGGFVGVDVFFVISGFLISSIIFTQLENGSFSFWQFYSRRIRRIYPVLITVLVACLAFGWFFLLSDEYLQLGKHVAGGAGFVSNFILWFESGYFDNAANSKPLLHLWSLGIEEQFYIVWPFLLWLAWKKRFNLFTVSFLIAAVSFALNLHWYKLKPVMDFFSPQTRFWELLCGAMLAWTNLHFRETLLPLKERMTIFFHRIIFLGSEKPDEKLLSHVLSVLGMLLLVVAVFVTKEKGFPGKWALLPVLAAVLLIAAGKDGWFNRTVLSNRILVWFGIISYPLYLWHWPVLCFARIVLQNEPPLWYRIIAFPFCVLLSYLTTKFIENPLRFGVFNKSKNSLLFGIMLSIGFASFIIFKKNGIPSRFPKQIEKLKLEEKFSELWSQSDANCNSLFPQWKNNNPWICLASKPAEKITYAAIGDSHAGHLFGGLSFQMRKNEGIAIFSAGCTSPFIDLVIASDKNPTLKKERIKTSNNHKQAYELIIKNEKIHSVFLAYHPQCAYKDGIFDMRNPDEKDINKIYKNGIKRTFDLLKNANKNVIILLDNPTLPYEPRENVFNSFFTFSQKTYFDRSIYDRDEPLQQFNQLVRFIAKDYPNITIFDLSDLFCDEKKCFSEKDNRTLYRDKDHLNLIGSVYVAQNIFQTLYNKQNQPDNRF